MALPTNRTVPLIVAAALFMEHLDSTIISTALPAMAEDIGVSPVRLNLAITAYLVTMAVFIPASGWLADKIGARHVFVGAIGLFLAGSLSSGAAPNLEILVLGRLVQGLGGAMMVPVGRLVLLRSVPKDELLGAMAWLTVPALIGPVIGPPLGGFITTYSSWRWIFWINLPIGVIGIVVALLLLPNVRERSVPPFDLQGFIISSVGLALMVFGLETVGRGVFPSQISIAAGIAGVALLWVYVRHARGTPRPLVDIALLKIPTFRAAVVGGSLFRIGVGAIPFLLPLQLQIGFGRSPIESGLTTFASAAGAMTMKFAASRIIDTLGFRRTLVLNAVLASLFLVAIAAIGPGWPTTLVIALLLAGGFFRSLEFTAINAIGYSDVDQARMSRATAFTSMAQQLSISGGVALAAFILHLLGVGDREPTIVDFQIAIVIVGVISLTSVGYFWRLSPEAGRDMIRSRKKAAAEPATASGAAE
ncbi:MFS transporter [Methyloraptor flagellatus]|uniref:MFS transporter n=1 Tax=Methyloraptor flagellatus TaxID=3162530 RepID=A0AAU7XBW5_9HYPH